METLTTATIARIELKRSIYWSQFFQKYTDIKDDESNAIDFQKNDEDEIFIDDDDGGDWDEAEESETEDRTLLNVDALQEISNIMCIKSEKSPHEKNQKTLLDDEDNSLNTSILVNETLPIIEEHQRKCKEIGADSIFNTFDAKAIEQKFGFLMYNNNLDITGLPHQIDLDSSTEFNKQQTHNLISRIGNDMLNINKKEINKHEHDNSSDADSMHSIETARYVLAMRKSRSIKNSAKTKTVIKSYCKQKSRQNLLHKKYAIDEEDSSGLTSSSRKSVNNRSVISPLGRFVKSERRCKLLRKRRLLADDAYNGSSSDESVSHIKKKIQEDAKLYEQGRYSEKKLSGTWLVENCDQPVHKQNIDNGEKLSLSKNKAKTLKGSEEKRSRVPAVNAESVKKRSFEIEISKKQKNPGGKINMGEKLPKRVYTIKATQKNIDFDLKKNNDKKDSMKNIKNKKKLLKKKAERQKAKSKKNEEKAGAGDNTFQRELKTAIELSKETYKQENEIRVPKIVYHEATLTCGSGNDTVNEPAQENEAYSNNTQISEKDIEKIEDYIDDEKNHSIQITLRPQPKSAKLRKLAKLKANKTENNIYDNSFFNGVNKACNSTVIGDMAMTSRQKHVRSNKKRVVLYTPKDKNSLLSPNTRKGNSFNITHELLSSVLGEEKAKKFFKYHSGRRIFDVNSTVYYCPPEKDVINETWSDDDELNNIDKYGHLDESYEHK